MMDMNNMFGKLGPGMCRLTPNGRIAVKTNNGYRSYDVKKGRLINCSNFVFDIGEEFFFVMPTSKVKPGDIILVDGLPKCVKEVKKDSIVVINYENSTIDTILPERHIFMGNTYFYGKIVSLFGGNPGKDNNALKSMMKYKMMAQMFGGKAELPFGNSFMNAESTDSNMMNIIFMMNMMSGNDMFGNLFDDIDFFGDSTKDSEDLFDVLEESEDE